jgi:hypothetical protein
MSAMKGRNSSRLRPCLVEVVGRPVGSGDHGHAGVEQMREEPRQDHRVGGVVDHHLVEAQQPRFLSQRGGDRRHRVTPLSGALDAQPLVHVHHEFVEVDAALGWYRRLEGEVHQHGFAPPHPAPHVDAAARLGLAAEQAGQETAAAGLPLERGLQPGQRFHGAGLVGVRPQFAGRDQLLVAIAHLAHRASTALRSVAE